MPQGKQGMSMEQLKNLAKAGAEATLARLRAEIVAIESTFPELASAKGRRRTLQTAERRAYHMSTAARKAVSARMKKYWAERRKAKAGK
jgi:hypothetical protein